MESIFTLKEWKGCFGPNADGFGYSLKTRLKPKVRREDQTLLSLEKPVFSLKHASLFLSSYFPNTDV